MANPKPRQTKEDREYILQNLPEGTRRVQVLTDQGNREYKSPADVNVDTDEIMMNSSGLPIVMRGKPGRRKKRALKPVTPQIAEVSKARDEHMDTNDVIQHARRNPDSDEALNAIIVAMAEEAASIEFDRMEAQRHGEDTTNHAAKRARVLKSLGDLMIKRKQAVEGRLPDLDSPEFNTLFSFILETFKDAMVDGGCRNEQIEQVFTSLTSSLNTDWKEEAKARMKEKLS